MTSTWSTAASGALLLAGCGIVVSGEELGDEGGVEADLAEYQALADALEAEREQALAEDAIVVATAGPWIAWIADAKLGLRRYPDQLELELPAPSLGVRISATHVLTAELVDAGVVYRAVSLPDAELVDEQLVAGASSSFALLDDVALALDTTAVGAVWRWRVGVEVPAVVGELAEVGLDPAAIVELEAIAAADGELLIIHADATLWQLELASWTASVVAELDELLAADARGILVRRADGLYLHELAGETRRIDAEIAASGWSLNPTFASIHEYTGDGATLADDRVIYIGSAGVFAFDLDATGPAAITPILIEHRWDIGAGIPRIEYREPLVNTHRVFARGLIGQAGEVGASGPIYAAPLEP